MRLTILATCALCLVGCDGTVQVFRPLPNGDTPGADPATDPSPPLLDIVDSWTDVPPPTYVSVELSHAGALDGVYGAWCVDPSDGWGFGPYPVDLYSSYASPPPGAAAEPANLDLVNYVINTFAVDDGLVVDCGDGGPYAYALTVDDIQEAIWSLVSASPAPTGYCVADEILARAHAEGEHYMPGCDDKLAVIAQPVSNENPDPNDNAQTFALEMPQSADGCHSP